MILPDADLEVLYPSASAGPNSIDLRIGDELLLWPVYVTRDPRTDQSHLWQPAPLVDGAWTLQPGTRYLAATYETVLLPNHYVGQIAGRSSWGRDGLAVICGPAGIIDAGWNGRITLELSVVGSPLILWPRARICQMVVSMLTRPSRGYIGKYQGDSAPTPSRLHQDADLATGVPA